MTAKSLVITLVDEIHDLESDTGHPCDVGLLREVLGCLLNPWQPFIS